MNSPRPLARWWHSACHALFFSFTRILRSHNVFIISIVSMELEGLLHLEEIIPSHSSGGCLQEELEILDFEEKRNQNANFSCLQRRLRRSPVTRWGGALGLAASRSPSRAHALRCTKHTSPIYRRPVIYRNISVVSASSTDRFIFMPSKDR